MNCKWVPVFVLVVLLLAAMACGQGTTSQTGKEGPTAPPAAKATDKPAAPAPTSTSAKIEKEHDTAFPLPDNVQNFMGEGGESTVIFQTKLSIKEVAEFYRKALAEKGLSEYKVLTEISDDGFSMVFTSWPDGREVVIQGVDFGDSVNVTIRLEEVVESAGGAPADASPADEQRSEVGGFAYQAIPGYTTEEEMGFVSMEAPDADSELGPAVLMMGGALGESKTSQELYDKFVADLEVGIEVSKPREITVGGAPGLEADISSSSGGAQMAGRVVFVVVSEARYFTLFGAAPAGRWEGELAPLFDALVASVKFFEPAAAAESGGASGGEIRQWATSAAASSEYGRNSRTASEATGAPNTSTCGEMNTAWQSEGSDTVEWIELGYATAVYATQVNVVQSNNPSQVIKVELIDTAGDYHNIYLGDPQSIAECPYTLSVAVNGADYKAIGVRIIIDQSMYGGHTWNAIDAVELVGQSSPSSAAAPPAASPTSAPPKPSTAKASPGWTTFKTQDGLAHNEIKAVAVGPDGAAWFGTNNAGLSRFDPSAGAGGSSWTTYTKNDGLAYNVVQSLGIDSSGALWAGTYGLGVSRFDGQQWTTFATKDGLVNGSVNDIAFAPDGSVWLAEYKGISHFGKKWTAFTKDNGLAETNFTSIAVAPGGTVWAASWNGVWRFDGNKWADYTQQVGLDKDPHSLAVAVAPDGAVWFGSRGGAFRFDGQKSIQYTPSEGLAGYLVNDIAVAPAPPGGGTGGALWFATGNGVSRFDGQDWTTYTAADGLVTDWVERIAVGPDGTVWMGTKEGVSRYVP